MRKFLEESIFEESAVVKERAAAEGNARVEDVVVVYRNKGGEGERKLQYFVVDGIEALNKFGADPWCVPFLSSPHFGVIIMPPFVCTCRERVVCVMTTGQAWQFRPYKWSEPKQLFHNGTSLYRSFHSPMSINLMPRYQLRASTCAGRTTRPIPKSRTGM